MKHYLRTVNYYETDQMGVVHHSNYFRYFEEARSSFMEQVGYPYKRMEDEGVISPVVSIECQYKKPVKYGERVDILVFLTGMNQAKCTFKYEVRDAETNELRSVGSSVHCFLGCDGKVVSIKKKNPEFFERFTAQIDKE